MSHRCLLLLLICLFTGSALFARSGPDSLRVISDLSSLKVDANQDAVPDFIGDTVRVRGVASISTGLLHERFLQVFIQHDSTGLSLFAEHFDAPIKAGDSLTATGIIQKYYGLTELKVLDYTINPKPTSTLLKIPLSEALNNRRKYEGMLVQGKGIVVGMGHRYNGKFLRISPIGNEEKSIMIYITNFHSKYQGFDFKSISTGDEVNITGILTMYNPNTPHENEPVFKIHLRTPNDLQVVGISKSGIIFWGSLTLVAIVLVLGWVILLRSTVKRKTQDLEQSLTEKEVLLKEIHHRVKNNLAIMSGLFELQLDGDINDETRQTLLNSQSRLKSMALVHDKLYKTKNLTEIDMDNYISEMGWSLHDTLEGPGQNIIMNFDIDDVELNIDQAIPCGLLINEIVVNAFKHAFAFKKEGQIHISLKKKGSNIELYIADDGLGIPDSFDIEKSTSLGMMLIETFKSQLKAEMKTSNKDGTAFTFIFPV